MTGNFISLASDFHRWTLFKPTFNVNDSERWVLRSFWPEVFWPLLYHSIKINKKRFIRCYPCNKVTQVTTGLFLCKFISWSRTGRGGRPTTKILQRTAAKHRCGRHAVKWENCTALLASRPGHIKTKEDIQLLGCCPLNNILCKVLWR